MMLTFFLCLLAICIFSLVMSLQFCLFLNWVVCFLTVEFNVSLCILDTCLLPDMCFAIYQRRLPVHGLVFHSLISPLQNSYFNFNEVQLNFFPPRNGYLVVQHHLTELIMFCTIFTEIQLGYNIVVVSGIQQSDSAIR